MLALELAGGRAAALRVAAAVLAKRWLKREFGIDIRAHLAQLGPYRPQHFDRDEVERNGLFWPDRAQLDEVEAYLDGLRKAGDSVGGRVTVVADGVPPGLGEPTYGKLDAELAAALMGIPAVKAVEIGDGVAVVDQRGSEHRDEFGPDGFYSNHAGGILGGISTGQALIAHLSLKPTSSIRIPGRSVDREGRPVDVVTTGRHDPCVAIRAAPIAEAMVALVLIDQALRHRAQVGRYTPRLPHVPGARGARVVGSVTIEEE
jgi:chorismate synthase